MNVKDKQRDQAWTHFAISGLLPEGWGPEMASFTDKHHCEDLPTAQEKIGKAAVSGIPSRVLITQTQFLVSNSLLRQQSFLSCHAYQWEFVASIYKLLNRKKYSCHLLLMKKPPKDKRPEKSLQHLPFLRDTEHPACQERQNLDFLKKSSAALFTLDI